MNDELRHFVHGTFKPFADYLGCAVCRQDVGIVVFNDGGFVVPVGAAIDERGLDTRDADSKRCFTLESKGGVFEGVDIYEESQAAGFGIVYGYFEVDCCPLFVACLALADVSVDATFITWVL